jgi:hypothetical protein
MKYYTEAKLAVIEEFKLNKGKLVISYRKDGTMKKYNASFASTFSILLRRGVIERGASGDFR